MTKDELIAYVAERFSTDAEYPWDDENFIFRHQENRKWYALFMKISKDKLGLKNTESVWILNLKCDPLFIGSLLEMDGYYPAYHMNKNHWITLLLDGTIDEKQVLELLDLSYHLTEKRKKA